MADTTQEPTNSVSENKFKEAVAAYASQGGVERNKVNKAAFYAGFDGFVKDSLKAGKTPDEIQGDISRILDETRSGGLADDNRHGDGKIATMQGWSDKAMDRVARYYDVVNGIAEPENGRETETFLESFKKSAQAYVSETGEENNRKNKQAFYASLDALMQNGLGKGMTPQEVAADVGATLDGLYNDALTAADTPAAKKVPTLVKWSDKVADQVAGYYDVMIKNTEKENMTENLQDVENTNLPAVRGNAMPARTRETRQEQPDPHPARVDQTAETANTVLPAVRGDETPAKEQKIQTTEETEKSFADNFIKFSQRNSEENGQALATSLRDLVTGYRAQGFSARETQEKISELLTSSVYDTGIEQGVSADLLKKNIASITDFMERQISEAEKAEQQMYETVADDRVVLPAVRSHSHENANEAEDVEYVEETPAETINDVVKDDLTPQEENDENDDVVTPPQEENKGNDDVVTPPQEENEGNDDTVTPPQEEIQGNFNFFTDEGEEHRHEPVNPAVSSDLKQQLIDTAFKNRYMMLEDALYRKDHICPFAQLKINCFKDDHTDKKNPYVRMDFESGNKIYNRPNQVDVHYVTYVSRDDNGKVVKKPQISFEECMTAVRLGMEKGWTAATLSGPDAYKEQMYLAMCALGMKVVGFEPSEELKKKGAEFAEKHAVDLNHARHIDKNFKDFEAARIKAGFKEPEEIGKDFIAGFEGGRSSRTNENAAEHQAAATNENTALNSTPSSSKKEENQEPAQQPTALPEHTETAKPKALPEHTESSQQKPAATTEHTETAKPKALPEHTESSQQKPETALVSVTPEIQNKMSLVAKSATTALAKTDPAKAQQAAAEIASVSGISKQLQAAGKAANEAKGNDAKAAQKQQQQETSLALTVRNNNRTK